MKAFDNQEGNISKQKIVSSEIQALAPDVSSSFIVRTSINQRENNEDSFHIYDLYVAASQKPLKVLAIADGMGGHAYGEHVSREALHRASLTLFDQLCVSPIINSQPQIKQAVDIQRVAKALWDALEQANIYIRRMVQTNKWGKAGSTIVIAAIFENQALVVNLGDSPLFHYQASSRSLKKITEDHTVAGALLRSGMITPEMAQYHEGRSRLEFFIGSEALPRKAPIHRVVLSHGDLLLLCTDGVSGMLDLQQIEAILAAPESNLEIMAERLFNEALIKGETDNQTLIIWREEPLQAEEPIKPPEAAQIPEDFYNAPTVQIERSETSSGNPFMPFGKQEKGEK